MRDAVEPEIRPQGYREGSLPRFMGIYTRCIPRFLQAFLSGLRTPSGPNRKTKSHMSITDPQNQPIELQTF